MAPEERTRGQQQEKRSWDQGKDWHGVQYVQYASGEWYSGYQKDLRETRHLTSLS